LVSPHDLGVAIQQETPQLLMEGDTLDDHVTFDDQPKCHDQITLDSLDTICVGVQEETANSLCDQNNIMELLLSTTPTSHDGIHDIDQLSVHSSTYSLGSSTSFTSSSDVLDSVSISVDHVLTSTNHVITSLDHVISPKDHVITPKGHVIVPTDHVIATKEQMIIPTDNVIVPTDHVITPKDHVTTTSTCCVNLPDLCTNTDENDTSLAVNFVETTVTQTSSSFPCTSIMTPVSCSLPQAMAHLNSSINSSLVNTPSAVTLLAAAAAGTIPCSIIVPLSLPNCGCIPSTLPQCSAPLAFSSCTG